MCARVDPLPMVGDGRPPTFNDGILISWGPINPYGLGLSFPSPMEMSWELSLDPIRTCFQKRSGDFPAGRPGLARPPTLSEGVGSEKTQSSLGE